MSSSDTGLERPAEFPFTEWQMGVEDAGNRLTSRVKHRVRSAYEHLRRAGRLLGIDDEMAAFRAITAEEEAATALILALQMRGYPGADRLNPREHLHKNAFWPLIQAINRVFAQSKFPSPQILMPREGQPIVRIRLNLTAMAGRTGAPVWIEPDHPLNFALKAGQASDTAVHLFEAELEELANEAGSHSIAAHVKVAANKRNHLLYAGDRGIAAARLSDDTLRAHAVRTSVLAFATVMIMQTREKQLFAVQCLEGLLRALDKFEGLAFDYSDVGVSSGRPVVTVHRIQDEPASISVRRHLGPQKVWWGSNGYGRRLPRSYNIDLSYDRSAATTNDDV